MAAVIPSQAWLICMTIALMDREGNHDSQGHLDQRLMWETLQSNDIDFMSLSGLAGHWQNPNKLMGSRKAGRQMAVCSGVSHAIKLAASCQCHTLIANLKF